MSNPPKIDAVLSSASSSQLGLGTTLTLTLDANAALAIDTTAGAPSLRLSNGAAATYDPAASTAAGADKLVFTYTVAAGQDTPDLQIVALDLNGAVILGPSTTAGFAPYASFPASSSAGNSYGVAVGDLNGDGVLDIVSTNYNGTAFSVRLGDGTGSFLPVQSYATGSQSIGAALGDVNGDGKLDLVLGNERGGRTVSLHLGDGSGQFGAAQSIAIQGSGYTDAVALADVTGDGKLDLIVTGPINSGVSVLAGDGAGNFAAPVSFAAGTGSYGIAVVDLDGDGALDIVIGSNQTGQIQLLKGDGTGQFAAPITVATGSSNFGVTVADVTGDGKLDIIAGSFSNVVSIFAGDGAGQFAPGQTLANAGLSTAVADITGDTLPDLIVVDGGNALRVLAGQVSQPGAPLDLTSVATANGADINLMVDATLPALAGLALTLDGVTPTRTLHPGDIATVTVSLDEAVSLSSGGGAVLTLSNGAVLSGGTVTPDGLSLVFQYEVSAGDSTTELMVSGLSLTMGTTLRDAAGNDVALASITGTLAVAVNSVPAGAPAIVGMAMQGETLLTSVDNLTDADGLDAATIHYQWQQQVSDGTWQDIAGARAMSYALAQADVGHALRVVVAYTDGQGTAEAVTSAATAAIANVNDAPTGLPVLAGAAQQGAVLSADLGRLSDADGLDLASVSYQWQRNDGPDGAFVTVAGATAASYALTQADVGHQLQLVAAYIDGQGTAEAVTSAATAAIANVNDAPTGEVILTGTPTRGSVLIATSTLADADGLGTLTYQWQRDDGTGASVAIDGATGSSYTLSRDDIGHTIHVAVSYIDGGSTAEEVTSAASPTVAARTVSVEPPADGVSSTLSLTSTEVAARLADGDVLMPPDQAAVIALADGSVSFGAATDAAFLTRLYGGLLGREGEANGLSFWAHHASGSLNKVEVAEGFLASAEYQVGHGSLDNSQFVEGLYRDMLQRVGEADGVAAHLQALTAGMSRADILVNFAESPEAQDHWSATTASGIFVPGEYAGLIRAAYATAFGREAEASGLVWQGQALTHDLTAADFGDAIASSAEFLALHGNQSDHDLIAALYVDGLGREGSGQEIAFYEDQLANQTLDRGDLVLAFATSSEAQNYLQWLL